MENVWKIVKKMKFIKMENASVKMAMRESMISAPNALRIQLLLLIKVSVSVKVDFNGKMVSALKLNALRTQNLFIKTIITNVNVSQAMWCSEANVNLSVASMKNFITINVDVLMGMLKLMESVESVHSILSLTSIGLNASVIIIIIGIPKEEHVITLNAPKILNQFCLIKNTNVSVLKDISCIKTNAIWILIVELTRYSLEAVFVKFLMWESMVNARAVLKILPQPKITPSVFVTRDMFGIK